MRRRTLALLLSLTLVGTTVGFAFVSTPLASANVCSSIPSLPLVPNPLKTVCTVVVKAPTIVTNPIGTIGKILAAPFKAAGDAVMQGVTDWVAAGAAWLVDEAGALINARTTPTLGAPWFTNQYQTMAALAAIFALPLLLLSILEGVLRRDGRIIVRAACVQLPAAFLLTAGAVVIVGLFVAMTDQMCAQVTGTVNGDAKTFFAGVAKALTTLPSQTGSGAIPLFAVFLGGLIAAVGSFFVWVELLIRSAAIYVAVLFLPFTFVAMIWPQTAKWCRRLVELLFAIIFSKFVIVAIMALAAAGLLSAGTVQGFNGVLAGTALLLLASFSPMALLRLIPMVEGAAHASSNRSGAGSSALGPVAGPAAVMRRVMDGNWGSGGGGLHAAPAAAGGPAVFAAAGGAAAMSGAVRTASKTANGGSSGGPSASPGQDGGRYAAVGSSGGGQAARPAAPASGTTATGAGTSAGSPSPGSGGAAGATSGPPSATQQSPTTGRQASSPQTAAGGARSARPPVEPPRDPARQRSNDQQTRRDS
jgi:hypothetical protein